MREIKVPREYKAYCEGDKSEPEAVKTTSKTIAAAPKQGNKKRINVDLTPEQHRKFDIKTTQDGITMTAFLRAKVEAYVNGR